MRKIFVIFSLIALLTFVFPVAASSPAPTFDEGDSGTVLVKLSYLNGVMNDYVGNVWQDVIVRQVVTRTETQLRQWRILGHLMLIIEEMARYQPNPSH